MGTVWHPSIHKQFLFIAFPPRPLVRYFQNYLGCSPVGPVTVVHAQMWFQSFNKYGHHWTCCIFPVMASPPWRYFVEILHMDSSQPLDHLPENNSGPLTNMAERWPF